MKESIYGSREALVADFSQKIVAILSQSISQNGAASILVSGGSTPLPLFKTLSESDLDWSKVTISLADERWVEPTDAASNEKLVRENLLRNKASQAIFIGMKTPHKDANDGLEELNSRFSSMSWPADVLILGMGEDAHTASLFPCSKQIEEGLSTQEKLLAVTPTTAPHQRMSFSLNALVQSKNIFLHLTGDSKKSVLDKALSGVDLSLIENASSKESASLKQNTLEMPIRAVLQNAEVELLWAP